MFADTPSTQFVNFGIAPQGFISSTAQPFQNIIDAMANTFGVDSRLISAVIKTESNFDPRATRYEPKLNTKSAGLMQLLPATASSELGRTVTTQDLFDPYTNILAGTKYLKSQLDKYRGNIPLAVSAYNAGHALVDSHGNIVNSDYVDKVMANYTYFKTGRYSFNMMPWLAASLGLFAVVGYLFLQPPKRQVAFSGNI